MTRRGNRLALILAILSLSITGWLGTDSPRSPAVLADHVAQTPDGWTLRWPHQDVRPGEAVSLAVGRWTCCTYFVPLGDDQPPPGTPPPPPPPAGASEWKVTSWTVLPRGAGILTRPTATEGDKTAQRTLRVSGNAAHGTQIVVIARLNSGATLTAKRTVYAEGTNALEGRWVATEQLLCDGSTRLLPTRWPMRTFWFNTGGEFTMEWHSTPDKAQMIGTYLFHPATGTLEVTVTDASYASAPSQATGRVTVLAADRLRLQGFDFGPPPQASNDLPTRNVCGHILRRHKPGMSLSLETVNVVAGASDRTVSFVAQGEGIFLFRVDVYDLTGQRIWTGEAAGPRLTWDLRTVQGHRIANGVYLYRATVRGPDGQVAHSTVHKLIVMR